jgi:hypothetical protein
LALQTFICNKNTMNQNPDRRLTTTVIEEENLALVGLRGLPDYRPVREEASLESAEAAAAEMLAARAHEAMLKAQLQEATEVSKAAEWKFHNCMKAARDSVTAHLVM